MKKLWNQLLFISGNIILLMSLFYALIFVFIGKYDSEIDFLIRYGLSFIGLYIYFILHELGHAIAGYLTGYEIKGFGLLHLGFIKENDHYRFRRLSMPNVGAYYISIKKDKSDKKFKLMIMGGILMNFALSCFFLLCYFITNHIDYLFHLGINAGIILTNISNVITLSDGSKYFEMKNNNKYIDYMYNQMDISYAVLLKEKIADVKIQDVVLEHSYIVETQYAYKGYQYLYTDQLEKAKEHFDKLKQFSKDKSIISSTNIQLLEIAILEGNKELAKTLFTDKLSQVYLKRKTKGIALRRAMYFMYIEENCKKAEKEIKLYDKYKQVDPTCYEESKAEEKYLTLVVNAINYSKQFEDNHA